MPSEALVSVAAPPGAASLPVRAVDARGPHPVADPVVLVGFAGSRAPLVVVLTTRPNALTDARREGLADARVLGVPFG